MQAVYAILLSELIYSIRSNLRLNIACLNEDGKYKDFQCIVKIVKYTFLCFFIHLKQKVFNEGLNTVLFCIH